VVVTAEGAPTASGPKAPPAGLLPAGLIDVLDRGLSHRLQGLGVARAQGSAYLPLQVADGAQGQRHLEDGLGDLLQAALSDVVTAGQGGQGGGQARADAVGLDCGWDGGVAERAATQGGAVVPLVLGDLGGRRRQFRDLMPGQLGVIGARQGRQRRAAAVAVGRDEGDGTGDALRRETALQVGGVAGLGAGLVAGMGLGDRLGGTWAVGRGGVEELVALVPRRAVRSRTSASVRSATGRFRSAISASRSRHPGHVTVATTAS
jgi:hypothetical protein